MLVPKLCKMHNQAFKYTASVRVHVRRADETHMYKVLTRVKPDGIRVKHFHTNNLGSTKPPLVFPRAALSPR